MLPLCTQWAPVGATGETFCGHAPSGGGSCPLGTDVFLRNDYEGRLPKTRTGIGEQSLDDTAPKIRTGIGAGMRERACTEGVKVPRSCSPKTRASQGIGEPDVKRRRTGSPPRTRTGIGAGRQGRSDTAEDMVPRSCSPRTRAVQGIGEPGAKRRRTGSPPKTRTGTGGGEEDCSTQARVCIDEQYRSPVAATVISESSFNNPPQCSTPTRRRLDAKRPCQGALAGRAPLPLRSSGAGRSLAAPWRPSPAIRRGGGTVGAASVPPRGGCPQQRQALRHLRTPTTSRASEGSRRVL